MPKNASKMSSEKPLQGALLCCTSIAPEDRTRLAEYALEMGAEHTLDLTSDVTHLLVGDTDSKKYQYVAREREDVKVLLPEWVEKVRELWMNDETLDLNALEAQYKCPTLYGLKVCITGFEDLGFRNELAKNIEKNGGIYTGDLTKDVTHLIAFTPEGKKYRYAQTWDLKIVSVKWYKDTLDRGMQLDESLYHPTMLPERQGVGAWNRRSPSSARIGKRQRPEQPPQEVSRKLRRSASARFSSQHEDIWNDIAGQRAADENEEPRSKLLPVKPMPKLGQSMDPPLVDQPRPLSRTEKTPVPQIVPRPQQTLFLQNKHFVAKGFDEKRKALLVNVLTGQAASVHESTFDMDQLPEVSLNSRFLIVPHDIDNNRLAALRNLHNLTIVTELWLEWCMTVKNFVPPETYILGLPIPQSKLPAVIELVVNASGFPQVQTMHIMKISKKLGVSYQETFNAETMVLVCNSANVNHRKVHHAASWNVPAVTQNWFWELIKTGRKPPYEDFRVMHSKPTAAQADVREPDGMTKEQRLPRHICNSDKSRETVPAGRFARDSSRGVQDQQQKAVVTREVQEKPIPLKEIPVNVQSKNPSPTKKKLFKTFDGTSSDTAQDVVPAPLPQADDENDGPMQVDDEPVANSGVARNDSGNLRAEAVESGEDKTSKVLKEFFAVKAAAEANAKKQAATKSPSKKKLIGRALSNLSNSSRTSNDNGKSVADGNFKQPLSRASSVNSVNTDGLGVPLSALSRIPSDIKKPKQSDQPGQPALRGNANHTRPNTETGYDGQQINTMQQAPQLRGHKIDFHAALAQLSTSQPQPLTQPEPEPQLTYADTAEAARLKASLAARRRARAKLGQNAADAGPEMTREQREMLRRELSAEERERLRVEKERQQNQAVVIRDDEAVVGVGRRTRGREKALRHSMDVATGIGLGADNPEEKALFR